MTRTTEASTQTPNRGQTPQGTSKRNGGNELPPQTARAESEWGDDAPSRVWTVSLQSSVRQPSAPESFDWLFSEPWWVVALVLLLVVVMFVMLVATSPVWLFVLAGRAVVRWARWEAGWWSALLAAEAETAARLIAERADDLFGGDA